MLAGFRSREIWTWYFRPPRSRYAPSVAPWSVSACLLPLQAAQGLAQVAPRPAAVDALEEAVGRQLRLALEREAHVRAVAGGALELVDADRADAVVLAGAADHDDPPRPLGLDDRRVAPREALERRLALPPRAGALAVRVLAGQAPVDQEVVGELRVVGDVGEVLPDLLARARDGYLVDQLHGGRGVYAATRRRSRTVCPRSVCGTTWERSGGLRRSGRQSSQTTAPR